MDEKTSGQPQPARSSRQDSSASVPRDSAPERFGPVLVERLVKDDGRALLIYTRAEGADE